MSSTSSWLLHLNSTLSSLLQGHLKNIEEAVSVNLEWLKLRNEEAGRETSAPNTQFSASKKRKRGRGKKNLLSTTASNTPELVDTVTNNDALLPEKAATPVQNELSIVPITVSQSTIINATIVLTFLQFPKVPMTPSIAELTVGNSSAGLSKTVNMAVPHPSKSPVPSNVMQETLNAWQTDLSSVTSPMKTPLPTNNKTVLAPNLMKNDASLTPRKEPKVEAWTSKFIKKTSLGTIKDPPRDLPFVEVPPTVNETRTIDLKILAMAPPSGMKGTMHPLIAGLAVPPVESMPLPPSTVVTRKIQKKEISPETVESPLTRAKRVDAQNTWRETQLKNFLAAKADSVKSALGTLRANTTEVAIKPVTSEETTNELDVALTVPETCSKETTLPIAESSIHIVTIPNDPPVIEDQDSVSSFVSAEDLPQIDDVVFEPDPIPGPLSPQKEEAATKSVTLFSVIEKIPPADLTELERRRRLRERNEKAIEKKKQLLQKAQQIRSQTVANLSGKPKEVPTKKKTVTAAPITAIANKSLAPSLPKHTIINNVSQKDPGTPPRRIVDTTQSGVFKLPLPKVKTPGSAKPGEHPSSDDTTFVVTSQKNIDNPISPKLPHIASDEDELAPKSVPTKADRPIWANTPEVSKSLQQQRSIRPEDIFGEVEPVKLEGIMGKNIQEDGHHPYGTPNFVFLGV